MADTVRIKLTQNPIHNYQVGGVYEVEEQLARRLIERGAAEESSDDLGDPQPLDLEQAQQRQQQQEGEYRAAVTREGTAALRGERGEAEQEPPAPQRRR